MYPAIPLAERIRPQSLEQVFGQEHLVGEGKPLTKMLKNGMITSFIFWGPPGTGKTTIAKLVAKYIDAEFYQINAVSSGVKDIREIIEKAKSNTLFSKRTILFIDEIHRFNKSQQDALLGAVENGTITLIGATTENPSFEINSPLLSRARIYTLKSLDKEALNQIINYAIVNDDYIRELNIKDIDREFLIFASGGDARILLNVLDVAIQNKEDEDEIIITKEDVEEVIQQRKVNYDKNGEEHYNIISAFIKSIRGSDPDAALYWMARMLNAGEDPLFIARRMIISASEDVGNASPNGLLIANATFDAVSKIGMPEARIVLAQCATYLASCPKSNASYLAIDAALQEVRTGEQYAVPIHLRNPVTSLMKKLQYGKGYKYAHDFPNHFIEDNFLPEEMKGKQFYFPTELGQEKNLKERLKFLWKKLKSY